MSQIWLSFLKKRWEPGEYGLSGVGSALLASSADAQAPCTTRVAGQKKEPQTVETRTHNWTESSWIWETGDPRGPMIANLPAYVLFASLAFPKLVLYRCGGQMFPTRFSQHSPTGIDGSCSWIYLEGTRSGNAILAYPRYFTALRPDRISLV